MAKNKKDKKKRQSARKQVQPQDNNAVKAADASKKEAGTEVAAKNKDTDNTPAFKKAVEKTPDVCKGYKAGLGALGKYAAKISVPDPAKIEGSLDIDGETVRLYPDANRWDYAICYDGEVFYMEVHSAYTSEVSRVLKKLDWLKWWLNAKAPRIHKLTTKTHQPYYWVQSEKFAIIKHSPQYRAVVAKKLLPINILDLKTLL